MFYHFYATVDIQKAFEYSRMVCTNFAPEFSSEKCCLRFKLIQLSCKIADVIFAHKKSSPICYIITAGGWLFMVK